MSGKDLTIRVRSVDYHSLQEKYWNYKLFLRMMNIYKILMNEYFFLTFFNTLFINIIIC